MTYPWNFDPVRAIGVAFDVPTDGGVTNRRVFVDGHSAARARASRK
jgi:hypothetical protein